MAGDEFPAPNEGFVLTHFIVAAGVARSRDFYVGVLRGQGGAGRHRIEGVRDAGVETGPLEGSHAFQEVQSHLVPPVGRTLRVSRVQNAGVAPSHL